MLLSAYLPRFFLKLSFKIAFNQPIRFSRVQSNAIDSMVTLSRSFFRMASAASATPRDIPVAANATVFKYPTLARKFPLQAVARMSSSQAIVASPTQAASSPDRAVSSSTRAIASVFTRCSRKPSRNEERSLFSKRFCSGKKLLRTRLETTLLFELASLPVQKAACGGRETSLVATLSSAASILSTSRIRASVSIIPFRCLVLNPQ